MDVAFLLRGLVIGFSIAAPVGPIGALCIRRTLAHGRATGFVSGLGAATADAIYGAIGAFGLTALSAFLLGPSTWLRAIGGVFLALLGARTFAARPVTAATSTGRTGRLAGAFASTFALTLTNPTTILSFLGVFAGLGLAFGAGGAAAVALVLGVFLGSATLALGVGVFRERLDATALRWINRLSGVVIAGFGVAALVSLAA